LSSKEVVAVFARLSTFKGSMERLEEGVSLFTEKILPETEKQPGFAGALLLADRESGVAYSLTLWESKEALEARRDRARELAEMAARETGTQLHVSTCEVAVSKFPSLVA
jgi:hypothetical protein